ncbi:MAG: phosphotransferase, partial [Actinobacteria bacterium]|nr:phosphotransferase [Actinomycetota bacterium]
MVHAHVDANGHTVPHPHAAAGPDDPGPVMDAGAFATLYALDDTRVLRRYRSGADAGAEAQLLTHLAAHGVPVPWAVHRGGPDLEMERLHGPTLLQGLASGEVPIVDAARLLADLQAQLHAVPVPEDLLPGARAGHVIVHLDLHPGTVVLSDEHGPSVVAWGSATLGSPHVDVATTALLIAEVACDDGEEHARAARALLAAFLHASAALPDAALDSAAAHRIVEPWLVPGERELVPRAAGLVRAMVE